MASNFQTLRKNFPGMLNDEFKSKGRWPSMGEAVDSGERVFVFVRLGSALNIMIRNSNIKCILYIS